MQTDQTAALVAELYNAAYLVRQYQRGRSSVQRAQAVQRMGLAVRHAFNSSDDFAPLLRAVADGLVIVKHYDLAL